MLPETDASLNTSSHLALPTKPEPPAINLSFPGHHLQLDATASGCFPFTVRGTACLGCSGETQPKIQPQTQAKLVQVPGMLGQTEVKMVMNKTWLYLHDPHFPCPDSPAQLLVWASTKGYNCNRHKIAFAAAEILLFSLSQCNSFTQCLLNSLAAESFSADGYGWPVSAVRGFYFSPWNKYICPCRESFLRKKATDVRRK